MLTSTLVHCQQRRVLRRALSVECQVVRENDFKLVGSRSVDISPEGMLVESEAKVLTGDSLLVSFRLPRSSWWFDAEATVARVVHGRRPWDRGRCFALSFEGLEPDVHMFLRRALHGVPPPVPQRAPRIDYAASVHLTALS